MSSCTLYSCTSTTKAFDHGWRREQTGLKLSPPTSLRPLWKRLARDMPLFGYGRLCISMSVRSVHSESSSLSLSNATVRAYLNCAKCWTSHELLQNAFPYDTRTSSPFAIPLAFPWLFPAGITYTAILFSSMPLPTSTQQSWNCAFGPSGLTPL